MQARQAKRGFFDGSVHSVRDQGETQVRRRIATYIRCKNYARYEQDKENADFSMGAYTAYVTEKKRKYDEVLRRRFIIFSLCWFLESP